MTEPASGNSGAEPRLHSKRLGRELAMQFLFQCDMRQEMPDMEAWEVCRRQLCEEYALHDNRYTRKACDYAETLFTGVAVNRERIDETIRERSENWDFSRLSLVDRNIMRIAVFEMLFRPDVPPVVSINEAVEIAIDFSGERAGSFINGVLNGIKDTLSRPPRESVEKL